MTLEDMKAMELHEWAGETNQSCSVQRVPNGWIYIYQKQSGITSQFVPETLTSTLKTF